MSALLSKYITTKTSTAEVIDVEDFEIAEAAQDAFEATGDLEALHAGFEQLGHYAEALEGFGEPLTAREYALMHTAIENLDAGFVITDMESFEGGESSRAAAHEQALESIGESLKKFWQGIKNAFFRAWNAVKDFFAKLFGGSKKLKERADKVVKRAKDKGVREADKKVKIGGLSKIFLPGKEGDAMVKDGLALVEELATKGVAGPLEMVAKVASVKMSKIISDTKDAKSDEEANPLWKKAVDLEWFKKKHVEFYKGMVSNEKVVFPGGMSVGVTNIEDVKDTQSEEDMIAAVGKWTSLPKVVLSRDTKFTGKESDLQTPLSLTTIEAVAKLVDFVQASMESRDKATKEIDATSKENLKAVDKLIEESDKNALGKFWTSVRVRRVSSQVTRSATGVIDRLISYSFSVARTYVAYAEASVK